MARGASHSSADSLRTTFLIPNLHCPTCVSHITELVKELDPPPTLEDISTINHVATILHDRNMPASKISELLGSAGYEVFDIVLDPMSNEKLPSQDTHASHLEAAVIRWDPRRPQIDAEARARHDANCQMCAAYNGSRDVHGTLDSVRVQETEDHAQKYVATISIDGMTCSSCVGNVTRALTAVAGVDRADVALVNQSASVYFSSNDADASGNEFVQAVEDAGYDASLFELRRLPASGPAPEEKTNDFWKVTYSIEGMSCSSCVGKITEAVRRLDFVQDVDINLVAHAGTVTFRGKANEDAIRQTIDDTGYDATRTSLKPAAEDGQATSRTVSLLINGMHCPQCPKRIAAKLQHQVRIDKPLSLDDPIITITYTPHAPELTIRRIMDSIRSVDSSFAVSVHKPTTVEERSRRMLAAERKSIFLRCLLSLVSAIPTFIIGIVYMNLVSHEDSGYQYLMQPVHGVSRAEWATFIMATPIYFCAADYFHRRTIKEIWALWRPRSPVKILRRFYRFGSMNMLVSLGCTIAYFSSLAQLIVKASKNSSMEENAGQSYFDSVVFLTMFLLIGRLAEAHMKTKSGDAVSALGKLRPTVANIVVADDFEAGKSQIEQLDVDLLDVGDVVQLPHGSTPPCDGTLLGEAGQFDESSLTGESRLVQKGTGDPIFSGTINKGSAITMRVTSPAGLSMLDSIIQVVREGQSRRAPMERIADMLTAYFVPVIVLLAIVTWIVWLVLGLSGSLPDDYLDNTTGGWPFWSLQFAIAVFVIACPCGLGLAAPTALFVGGGIAAQRGILVKGGGVAFQEASNLDAVIFDKTGTLTEGIEPVVVRHKVFETENQNLDQKAIVGVLKAVEESSSHPLARAAVKFATEQSVSCTQLDNADEVAGKGLKASVTVSNNGQRMPYEALVGNEGLIQDYGVHIDQEAATLLETWKQSGYSVILLAVKLSAGWTLLASFAVADPVRPEAPEVIKALRARNVEVWMLSGDNASTARAVGGQIGINPDNIIAGVLPAEKADKVRYLQKAIRPRRNRGLHRLLGRRRTHATVAMVGDGINDSPALAAADVGIAMAAGSDVAIQSAAFVLVQSDLRTVLTLVNLSREVFRRVVLNFFWAAIYNIIALPVAGGVLYPIKTSGGTHVRLDPAWAALAMALSSITVVASSLLLRVKVPWVGFCE